MASARSLLTVVRDAESGQNWQAIATQLEGTDVAYNVLNRSDLTAESLAGVKVLFLPNQANLDSNQLQALTAWVEDRDGKLILSGAIGNHWPAAQQQQLRELVGAYWASDRAEMTPVAATPYPGNGWTEVVEATTPIRGGDLVPVSSLSRLAATWSNSLGGQPSDTQLLGAKPFDSDVAVVSTDQSIYLGWDWGSQPGDGAAVDRQWLTAAVDRFDANAMRLSAGSGGSGSTGTSYPHQVSSLPINTLEMLSMRQELGSLLGRVESAMLTTDAGDMEGNSLPPEYQQAIARARQVVKELPNWVASGQHEMARQTFEAAVAELWANYPRDRLTALPEVRAIWLDRGTIVDAGSPTALAAVFDKLAAAGINTVFFETINAGYPIYPSRIAPAQNPLTLSWDPLQAAVQLAHERDMELHAWMWTFAVGNTRHNLLPEIDRPSDYIGPVLTAHPDWANLDLHERKFPSGQPETWLDPANPQARAYLLSLIREMVQDYGVDGIQLDYIRYPFQNPSSRTTFGYGQAARQQFKQLTGADPIELDPNRDPSLWAMWTDFRVEQVSSFVADVSHTIRQLNPQVILSAAVYPIPQNERLQKLQQNWEAWIAKGDIDLLVPMTYVGNTRQLERLVEPTLAATSNSPVLLLPSLNLIDLPEVEFLDKMQAVRDLPTGGYSLFAARHLNVTFQDILDRSRIPSSLIPYRAPFSATAIRFAALRQEWEALLSKQQLWIAPSSLGEWQQQVDHLSKALIVLEKSPSESTLGQARTALKTMQDNLGDWMRSESLEHPYRVTTWANRLNALETLLRYGERNLPRILAARSASPSTSNSIAHSDPLAGSRLAVPSPSEPNR
jgi:uncharacterized lipoprotein YddW (UPF0748 family)